MPKYRKYNGGSGIDAVANRRAITVAHTKAIQSGGASFLPPYTETAGNRGTTYLALKNTNTLNQIGANGKLDNVGRDPVPVKGGSRRKSRKTKTKKRRTRRNKKSRKSRSRK